MSTPLRIGIALILLALIAFCGFGFAATFEPPGSPWLRAVYGFTAGLFVAGLFILARARRRS